MEKKKNIWGLVGRIIIILCIIVILISKSILENQIKELQKEILILKKEYKELNHKFIQNNFIKTINKRGK